MYSFAHQETGLFNGTILTTNSPEAVTANTPADHIPVAGAHDPFCRKFDHETRQVVDYVPPQPSEDHDWNDQARRWVLKPSAIARAAPSSPTLEQRIAALEEQLAKHDG